MRAGNVWRSHAFRALYSPAQGPRLSHRLSLCGAPLSPSAQPLHNNSTLRIARSAVSGVASSNDCFALSHASAADLV